MRDHDHFVARTNGKRQDRRRCRHVFSSGYDHVGVGMGHRHGRHVVGWVPQTRGTPRNDRSPRDKASHGPQCAHQVLPAHGAITGGDEVEHGEPPRLPVDGQGAPRPRRRPPGRADGQRAPGVHRARRAAAPDCGQGQASPPSVHCLASAAALAAYLAFAVPPAL